MVLGALPNAVGTEATLDVTLEAGDRIVLYTDGITDVFNSSGDMLGVEGVQKIVRETSLLPFKQMKQGILDLVAEWRDGRDRRCVARPCGSSLRFPLVRYL